ncbi:dihydrolipoyllysine-residue succinyltransferase component of 2-oxoglutarate dehydrogenase complex, putative [Babesia caballi]|uniref:dihydrolipoyllysine-residue succinyltransferase n=1 Tax=Babesia caballi TaxID=5871 RepID=A0AAV4M2A6_BABCB|nr:dihydrolipoyllysine-residue succinyltransferase component of 2-oxoglutarate dehydrogenase complex, putative [Babesia caballi]
MKLPSLGDSISEGTLSEWKKNVGDRIAVDEPLAIVETDKVTVDINSSLEGLIVKQHYEVDDTVFVGKPFVDVDTAAGEGSAAVPESRPDVAEVASKESKVESKEPVVEEAPKETRVQMTRMRKRIGERLKESQQTTVMLTTFNECDMSAIMALRKEINESGQAPVKLGFVSAYMKASTMALTKMPIMNSYIEGDEIVTKHFVDISVAVATPTGLVVPVIRDCQGKTWAELEQQLVDAAALAREGKLSLADMTGGTFTISNGGVYGSLLSTPIINPPQSSILGMHSIFKRCVVRDDAMVIRPIMNLALSYDHRLIDGREAVQFLIAIKEAIEKPELRRVGDGAHRARVVVLHDGLDLGGGHRVHAARVAHGHGDEGGLPAPEPHLVEVGEKPGRLGDVESDVGDGAAKVARLDDLAEGGSDSSHAGRVDDGARLRGAARADVDQAPFSSYADIAGEARAAVVEALGLGDGKGQGHRLVDVAATLLRGVAVGEDEGRDAGLQQALDGGEGGLAALPPDLETLERQLLAEPEGGDTLLLLGLRRRREPVLDDVHQKEQVGVCLAEPRDGVVDVGEEVQADQHGADGGPLGGVLEDAPAVLDALLGHLMDAVADELGGGGGPHGLGDAGVAHGGEGVAGDAGGREGRLVVDGVEKGLETGEEPGVLGHGLEEAEQNVHAGASPRADGNDDLVLGRLGGGAELDPELLLHDPLDVDAHFRHHRGVVDEHVGHVQLLQKVLHAAAGEAALLEGGPVDDSPRGGDGLESLVDEATNVNPFIRLVQIVDLLGFVEGGHGVAVVLFLLLLVLDFGESGLLRELRGDLGGPFRLDGLLCGHGLGGFRLVLDGDDGLGEGALLVGRDGRLGGLLLLLLAQLLRVVAGLVERLEGVRLGLGAVGDVVDGLSGRQELQRLELRELAHSVDELRSLPELEGGGGVGGALDLGDDDVAGALVDLADGAAPAPHVLDGADAALLENLVPLNVLLLVVGQLGQDAHVADEGEQPVEDVVLQLLLGVADDGAVADEVHALGAHPLEEQQRVVRVVGEREGRSGGSAERDGSAHEEDDDVGGLGVDLPLGAVHVVRELELWLHEGEAAPAPADGVVVVRPQGVEDEAVPGQGLPAHVDGALVLGGVAAAAADAFGAALGLLALAGLDEGAVNVHGNLLLQKLAQTPVEVLHAHGRLLPSGLVDVLVVDEEALGGHELLLGGEALAAGKVVGGDDAQLVGVLDPLRLRLAVLPSLEERVRSGLGAVVLQLQHGGEAAGDVEVVAQTLVLVERAVAAEAVGAVGVLDDFVEVGEETRVGGVGRLLGDGDLAQDLVQRRNDADTALGALLALLGLLLLLGVGGLGGRVDELVAEGGALAAEAVGVGRAGGDLDEVKREGAARNAKVGEVGAVGEDGRYLAVGGGAAGAGLVGVEGSAAAGDRLDGPGALDVDGADDASDVAAGVDVVEDLAAQPALGVLHVEQHLGDELLVQVAEGVADAVVDADGRLVQAEGGTLLLGQRAYVHSLGKGGLVPDEAGDHGLDFALDVLAGALDLEVGSHELVRPDEAVYEHVVLAEELAHLGHGGELVLGGEVAHDAELLGEGDVVLAVVIGAVKDEEVAAVVHGGVQRSSLFGRGDGVGPHEGADLVEPQLRHGGGWVVRDGLEDGRGFGQKGLELLPGEAAALGEQHGRTVLLALAAAAAAPGLVRFPPVDAAQRHVLPDLLEQNLRYEVAELLLEVPLALLEELHELLAVGMRLYGVEERGVLLGGVEKPLDEGADGLGAVQAPAHLLLRGGLRVLDHGLELVHRAQDRRGVAVSLAAVAQPGVPLADLAVVDDVHVGEVDVGTELIERLPDGQKLLVGPFLFPQDARQSVVEERRVPRLYVAAEVDLSHLQHVDVVLSHVDSRGAEEVAVALPLGELHLGGELLDAALADAVPGAVLLRPEEEGVEVAVGTDVALPEDERVKGVPLDVGGVLPLLALAVEVAEVLAPGVPRLLFLLVVLLIILLGVLAVVDRDGADARVAGVVASGGALGHVRGRRGVEGLLGGAGTLAETGAVEAERDVEELPLLGVLRGVEVEKEHLGELGHGLGGVLQRLLERVRVLAANVDVGNVVGVGVVKEALAVAAAGEERLAGDLEVGLVPEVPGEGVFGVCRRGVRGVGVARLLAAHQALVFEVALGGGEVAKQHAEELGVDVDELVLGLEHLEVAHVHRLEQKLDVGRGRQELVEDVAPGADAEAESSGEEPVVGGLPVGSDEEVGSVVGGAGDAPGHRQLRVVAFLRGDLPLEFPLVPAPVEVAAAGVLELLGDVVVAGHVTGLGEGGRDVEPPPLGRLLLRRPGVVLGLLHVAFVLRARCPVGTAVGGAAAAVAVVGAAVALALAGGFGKQLVEVVLGELLGLHAGQLVGLAGRGQRVELHVGEGLLQREDDAVSGLGVFGRGLGRVPHQNALPELPEVGVEGRLQGRDNGVEEAEDGAVGNLGALFGREVEERVVGVAVAVVVQLVVGGATGPARRRLAGKRRRGRRGVVDGELVLSFAAGFFEVFGASVAASLLIAPLVADGERRVAVGEVHLRVAANGHVGAVAAGWVAEELVLQRARPLALAVVPLGVRLRRQLALGPVRDVLPHHLRMVHGRVGPQHGVGGLGLAPDEHSALLVHEPVGLGEAAVRYHLLPAPAGGITGEAPVGPGGDGLLGVLEVDDGKLEADVREDPVLRVPVLHGGLDEDREVAGLAVGPGGAPGVEQQLVVEAAAMPLHGRLDVVLRLGQAPEGADGELDAGRGILGRRARL